MADMTIDDATLDTEVTGVERLPASDGGAAKAVTTAKIKDYVLAQIAALADGNAVSTGSDGIYLKRGGALVPVPANVIAAAFLDYAFGLDAIVTINGNEVVAIKDSTAKKSMTLTALKAWIEAGITKDATPTAASDNPVKSGGVYTALAGKVDKVEGKGLSKNDYTDADKAKLDGVVSNTQSDWNESDNTSPAYIKNKPEIQEEITVDDALDTESENPIANGAVAEAVNEIRDDIDDLDDAKVDKVAGKGLSANDYTDAEKTKLGAIAAGAQVNVIEKIEVDGTELTPSSGKKVSLNTGLIDTYCVVAGEEGTEYEGSFMPFDLTGMSDGKMWILWNEPTSGIANNIDVILPNGAMYFPQGGSSWYDASLNPCSVQPYNYHLVMRNDMDGPRFIFLNSWTDPNV